MAAFGAPIGLADHADRAIAASREMIGERLPLMNDWMREQGYGNGFRMGIGLHSGEFISGNVGSQQRLEYTAIGDVCNTASRIQDLTKGTRHMLLLSDSTRAALESAPEDIVGVGDFAIRGRQAQITLWSLESVSDPAPAEPVAATATRAS
jgi:adenylate cyclase